MKNDTTLELPYWCHEVLDDHRFDRFVITGGLGCIHGDTKIITVDGPKRIIDLTYPTQVLSLNHQSNQFELCQASPRHLKGKGYLFQVTTERGEFVANGLHQVSLSESSYRRVDQLQIGDVLSYCDDPLLTTSVLGLLRYVSNVPRLKKKVLNLICHYVWLFHQRDQQPQKAIDTGLDVSPLLNDVLKLYHSFESFFSFDMGDLLVRLHEHSQLGISCDHSDKMGCYDLFEGLGVNEVDQAFSLFFGHALLASPEYLRFLLMSLIHHKEELINCDHTSNHFLRSYFYSLRVSNATIIDIKKLKSNDTYYDLTVLKNHNYVTEDGTVHHNSAKTTNGLITFFLNVLQNPQAKIWWVIAPVYSRIDDSVIPAIIFGLSLMGILPNVHYKLIKSKPSQIKIIATGQTVMLLSADKPESMVSATLGGYFITEAFRIKREVYENVEARTRSNKVSRTLGILEGTPEGDTWGKTEFNIDKYDYARKLRRFTLHTHDNQANLHPSYIPRLFQIYAHNPAQIRSYIYGEFANFRTGNVFAQFLESRNLIPPMEADPEEEIDICFDFNVRPLTWSAWQTRLYKVGSVARVRDVCLAESDLNLTDLVKACASIALAFPPDRFKKTKFRIWGDRTGHAESHKAPGTDFSNIKKRLSEIYDHVEIKAPTQITPITASVDIVNSLLMHELILICDNCKNVRRSLNNTRWKEGAKRADLDKPAGETHTHHSDGMRYRMWWLYRKSDIDSLLTTRTFGTNL